jgi:signal transduction histidine kinase
MVRAMPETSSMPPDMPPPSERRAGEASAEQRRLLQALALAERERMLLGYEIHDGLVQDMTAAAMLLEGAGERADFRNPEDRDNYERGVRLLRECIAEARRLIRGLATVELDTGGLVSALGRLADKFCEDHGLPVQFHSDAEAVELSHAQQHLLLRIAQEALHNVWKHAQAQSVALRLMRHDGVLELDIEDDGVGFDPQRKVPGHYGLEGMRTRAAILGAELRIDSAPGRGTRVSVRLPMA